MATSPAIRQYSNRRTRRSPNMSEESSKSVKNADEASEKIKSLPSYNDSEDIVTIIEPKRRRPPTYTTNNPQVIVRKFNLPISQRGSQIAQLRDLQHDFQKPKQRWKQLCNLNQELSTTIPLAKVKIVNSSSPVTREIQSATLPVNKMSVTKFQELLKTSTENVSDDKNPILFSRKSVKLLPASIDTEKLSQNNLFVTSDTSSSHPVSPTTLSLPSNVMAAFPNKNSAMELLQSNKIIVTNVNQSQTSSRAVSPCAQTDEVPLSSSVTLTSPSTKTVSSQENKIFVPKIQSLDSPSRSGSVFVSNGNILSINKLSDSSPEGKKEITISASRNNKTDSSVMVMDTNGENISDGVLEKSENTSEQTVAKDVSTDGSCWRNLKTLPKHKIVGGRYIIVPQLSGKKLFIQESGTKNLSALNTVLLHSAKNSNSEDTKLLDGRQKEVAGSLLKATLLGMDHSKEQKELAVNSDTEEVNGVNSIHLPPVGVSTKPVENGLTVLPAEQNIDIKQALKQANSLEKLSDASVDSKKKTINLKQLQHEIALMKARQSIALKVERDVLRAKEVPVVRELFFPARRAMVRDVSCQTSLFSLLEPGRMVEMLLGVLENTSTNPGMVSAKGTVGSAEASSGMQTESGETSSVPKILTITDKQLSILLKSANDKGMGDDLEGPDKKKRKLDESSASGGSSNILVSDLNLGADMEVSSDEPRKSPNLSKNINLISVNPNLIHNSGVQLKGNLVNPKILHKPGKPRVEDKKSVFDIIVQHNIAAQAKLPNPGARPVSMVYIPDRNPLLSSTRIDNLNTQRNQNGDPVLPLPQNVNVQENAARISQLKQQAFEDWSRCLSPDSKGNIPLHKAVLLENTTLIKRQCVVLYARKASLDVPNNDKKTPLHLAVDYGNVEIVKLLLSFGAQPNVKDNDGNTALHLAVIDGNFECVEAILNCSNPSSLPLDDLNDEGYAPMHLCALRGKVEESRLLISKGADVNLKDARSGRTPLFHAVEANSGELVQLLLAADASTTEPNFSGHTPLSAASEISFSSRSHEKDFRLGDGINFSSKLVSLKSGESIAHLLEDANNMVIRGDVVEDVNMDEDDPDEIQCHNNTSSKVGSKNVWTQDV